MTALRVGHGYDVHRLVDGRTLILGGVTIPYEKGLLGHSDADVLLHAVMDALLGAAAMGDVGTYFPDTTLRFSAVPATLLERVHAMLAERGWNVVNVDATVVAQRPKIAPYLLQMRRNIAQALDIAVDQVNVKGTTEEKLGFTGDGSGMAAHAVCLMEQKQS